VKRVSSAQTPGPGSNPSERVAAQQTKRPRGIRTVVLSVVLLAGLAALSVGVLWSSLGPPEGTASNKRPATEGPVIAGTISVAPELRGRVSEGDTLFIIARKGNAGAGPPFAVKRIAEPHLPLDFRLGPEDVMMAGAAFQGSVHISVRLSKSGVAGPGEPGDLEGDYPGQVAVGTRGVNVVIERVR
jgi:cytochrome c-type biogenesis protein CcmH